jgi:hypothetical protein
VHANLTGGQRTTHGLPDSAGRILDSGHRPFIAQQAAIDSSLSSKPVVIAPTPTLAVQPWRPNDMTKTRSLLAAALAMLALAVAPAEAQVRAVNPDTAIDADLGVAAAPSSPPPVATETTSAPATPSTVASASDAPVPSPGVGSWNATNFGNADSVQAAPGTTYRQDDLIGAAERVFGKGAQGLAGIIEDILRKQGEPNGYITGREAGGAVALGVRYGSGTLHHKVEGNRPVYWTGPSLGFDLGANAGNAFVLVYNLNDTQDLYHRFGAGEGQAYLVGGFHVSYLRRKDVVLIPVRMGAGLRLGANIGYMKFSQRQRWVPF